MPLVSNLLQPTHSGVIRVVNSKRGFLYDVYIGRPSKWENPYSHLWGTLAKFHVPSRREAVEAYRAYILDQPALLEALPELDGKILGCFCDAWDYCHGNVLKELWDERCKA